MNSQTNYNSSSRGSPVDSWNRMAQAQMQVDHAAGETKMAAQSLETKHAIPNTPVDPHASEHKAGYAAIAACWVALVATIACNALFEGLKLGGVTSAEVSNQVFTWFMPAGYVFSIWGVIYAALVAWMIFETRRAMNGNALTVRQAALFVASCVLNVGWLVAFHFQHIALALIVLVALWAVLAALYMGLRDDPTRKKLNLAPFSLYHAWSTVAVVVNATNLGTRLMPASTLVNQVVAVVLTVAVLGVAFLAVRSSGDYVFPLVILWATVGVGINIMSADMMTSAVVLALSAIAALALYLPLLARAISPTRKSARFSASGE